jgi:hypothetical protein
MAWRVLFILNRIVADRRGLDGFRIPPSQRWRALWRSSRHIGVAGHSGLSGTVRVRTPIELARFPRMVSQSVPLRLISQSGVHAHPSFQQFIATLW